MDNLTLLYYTANTIEDQLGENVREHLLETNQGKYPIVSVSQKPLDFGENICVGEIGQSYYNCYKQILEGAKRVKTEYVALCEDDTLYNMEHFDRRPSSNKVFSYNKNMWYCEEQEFWNKGWVGLCTCIVATKYLIDTLEPRFKMYPDESKLLRKQMRFFQEPGKTDYKFGIPNANTEYPSTKTPIVTFNYFNGLGGKATSRVNEVKSVQTLEPYGDCWELKRKFWGRARPREELRPRYAQ